MEDLVTEQPLQQNRGRSAGPMPFELQWAASPYWPAAPVDFWTQSATGQGFPDLSATCTEEAEPSATNSGISTGEANWMGNLARMMVFSVLLIALLVASLLLGRTSTWLAEHDEATGQPADQQHLFPLAAGVASGRSGVGSWMHGNASQPLTAGASDAGGRRFNSRKVTKRTSKEEVETTEAVTSTAAEMPLQASRRGKREKLCGAFSFAFCHSPEHEFYFDASQGACIPVADQEAAALCNRGANKFTSLASCDAACGANANTVEPKCREEVLFTECKSEDISGPLWFFNGDLCRPWDFPGGLCPAANDSGANLFASSEECGRSCQERSSRTSGCGVPRQEGCSLDRLKQPYFANMAASGAAERCLKATAKNLARHLCLTGKNRFSTLEACRNACVGSTRV
ncbi:hypothetical protein HPB49_014255 [Dermacentor silvarum]|uniref:Uncharacterized protein n=1 Tax=Dermacentor silvarum TaxID=543639 RepID=A0ACB8CRL9_DERSI|nr:uncharacterized protein LOC119454176 [Dermacentor silvarum]KAH7949711.1 hypothetical protein HPB49_014255 [Dermacentor silvarum]